MKAAATDTTTPPDNVTVNCSDGCVVSLPLTPDQLSAQQAAASQVEQQQQADAANRAQLVSTVQAATDPAVLALARLFGVIQ